MTSPPSTLTRVDLRRDYMAKWASWTFSLSADCCLSHFLNTRKGRGGGGRLERANPGRYMTSTYFCHIPRVPRASLDLTTYPLCYCPLLQASCRHIISRNKYCLYCPNFRVTQRRISILESTRAYKL